MLNNWICTLVKLSVVGTVGFFFLVGTKGGKRLINIFRFTETFFKNHATWLVTSHPCQGCKNFVFFFNITCFIGQCYLKNKKSSCFLSLSLVYHRIRQKFSYSVSFMFFEAIITHVHEYILRGPEKFSCYCKPRGG